VKTENTKPQIVLNYLGLAHSDYLVARHLLIAGFLEHGAMLAATAVEKHFKAILGIQGIESNFHLNSKLSQLVCAKQPDLTKPLGASSDFLRFLEKAYRLRYAAVSAPEFSIVINQFRTLMSLDRLINELDFGFSLESNGKNLPTPYRSSLDANDPKLHENNVVLNTNTLQAFLSQQNKVLEVKIEKNLDGLRVEYVTDGVNQEGSMTKIPEVSRYKTEFTLTRG
jgi:hypothetical protein